MAKFKLNPPPINVFDSMMAYPDLYSKDRNTQVQLRDRAEKTALMWKIFDQYRGQQIEIYHPKRGEIRTIEMEGISGWNYLMHIIFGEWKLPTAAEAAAAKEKDRKAAEVEAKKEATRQAIQAGAIFEATAGAANTIMRFNDLNKKPEALVTEVAEPTEADLDALQEKIDAARALSKSKKAAKVKPAKE